MRAAFLLLIHSLKRMRTLVLTMGLVLAAFQIILIAVGRSFQDNGGFQQMAALIPPFAREMMGPSMVAFLSFAGQVCLGYFHPIPMGALVGLAIALATLPASEIETGFMDLILSRPLARHWIITRTIAALLVSTVFLLTLMAAGTWIGLETLGPKDADWPTVKLIRSLAVNLALLMLAWSGVALAIGAAARRRSVAGAITGLLAFAFFLLDYVGRLWRPAETVAWLSPFRYYSPMELVTGTPLAVKNLVVLSGIAVGGYVLAYVLFARRDISH
jgi:ABC-2 type transport system permease protein